MKIIDLFSGIGGLSLGFEWAGFEPVVAVDLWSDAIKTYNYNRTSKVGIVQDISSFNNQVLPEILKKNSINGVIGGPPCQGFSTVGTRDVNDPRNHLYLEFYKTVKISKPDFFVLENVRGMLTLNNGEFVKDLLKRFGSLGYNIEYKLLNAADFGVPQNRHRVFFVGVKRKKFEFPETKKNPISSLDGISDLPGLADKNQKKYKTVAQNEYQSFMRQNSKSILNHDFTLHSQQTVDVIKLVPDGGNIKSLPPEYWNIRKYNKAFERMSSNKPSNTIDTGHRNYFHFCENRIPTVRESARIQSFPDNFEILGTKGSQYKQVGNAVPPLLANEIANQIKKILNNK
jgi:DNA (cytosine-5)-methyltransferase 1